MDKEDMEMIELVIFSALFALFAFINLYRLIKGPTAADRMVAGVDWENQA